jgi:hypothetical protein
MDEEFAVQKRTVLAPIALIRDGWLRVRCGRWVLVIDVFAGGVVEMSSAGDQDVPLTAQFHDRLHVDPPQRV